jgi:hypothetical protein
MLGDHVSIVARRGIQQREADILLAVGFGKFVGAIDKYIDHAPIDFIELLVAERLVGHGSSPMK